MMRIAVISAGTLSFGLGCPFGAVAQSRNTAPGVVRCDLSYKF